MEEKTEENQKRVRMFSIILYKDSESYNYNDTIAFLKSMGQYAYIEHKPEKEEKKVHTHFLLKCPNAKTFETLHKKTSIPLQHIESVRSERFMIRYLIHFDNPEKIQYCLNDIQCSDTYKRVVRKAFDDMESEEVQISNIYNFINDLVKKTNKKHEILYLLIQYVNSNCYDIVYKRYRQEFNLYLQDLL